MDEQNINNSASVEKKDKKFGYGFWALVFAVVGPAILFAYFYSAVYFPSSISAIGGLFGYSIFKLCIIPVIFLIPSLFFIVRSGMREIGVSRRLAIIAMILLILIIPTYIFFAIGLMLATPGF